MKNIYLKMTQSKSEGLSIRQLKEWKKTKNYLIEDSCESEKNLQDVIKNKIIPYCELVFDKDGTISHRKEISLYECQMYFHKFENGPVPDITNKNVSMKPDGGIIFLNEIPILITEDKRQGTNDKLFAKNVKRQASGNAIERAAKNIRGASMLFCGESFFPYAVFCSGCDFHSSETIIKRIDMMNMGVKSHIVELPIQNPNYMDDILSKINISRLNDKYDIASFFVKTHKWDELSHGSSAWTRDEIETICKKIIDNVKIKLTHNL